MTSLPKSLDPQTLAALDGLTVRSRQLVEGLLAGIHRSPFRGVSVEFAEHREYVPGDDLRHVDWKVYGRTDKLYLKQFAEETNLHCVLLLDTSASMQYGATGGLTKLEYAQCLAVAFGWLVLRNGDAIGAGLGNDTLSQWLGATSHPEQLDRLIAFLSSSAEENSSLPDVPDFSAVLSQAADRLSQRSVVYVISDFLTDDVAQLMKGVQRLGAAGHDVTLLQVLDREELVFPFDGDVQFNGLEGGEIARVDATVIADRYQHLVAEFREALEAQTRNLGAEYELFVTDVNLKTALLTYFQRLHAKRSL